MLSTALTSSWYGLAVACLLTLAGLIQLDEPSKTRFEPQQETREDGKWLYPEAE